MSLPQVATIIGSGTMGPGIAATLAYAGVAVRVYDISDEALVRAEKNTVAAKGVLEQLSDGASNEGSISFVSDMAEALLGTQLVIEAVPEKLDLKEQVLAGVEDLVNDDVIIATNTSGIPITTMASTMKTPQRFIGMHWSNPPHLIPMIEVVPGEKTDTHVVEKLVAIVEAFEYSPVVQKEVPGFVENRVLYAILRECMALLEAEVVTPEGLDTAVKWGIGYKLAVVGPTRLLDMAGLDIYSAVSSYLNRDLDASSDTPKFISDLVEENRLGFKTGAGLYNYEPGEVESKRSDIVDGLTEVRKTLSKIASI